MIVMKETATEQEVDAVVEKIERAGALAHRSKGARVTVIGAIGDVEQDASVESLGLEGQPGVDRVVPILQDRGLFRTEYTGTTLRDHYGLRRPTNRFLEREVEAVPS